MSDMTVTLYVDSNGTHLHQIYSGLWLLHRSGAITLKLRGGHRLTKSRPNRQFIVLKLSCSAGSALAVFDMQDSAVIGLADSLAGCDHYVKRSLTEVSASGLDQHMARKLMPFGFNYQVTVPSKSLATTRVILEFLSRPYNPVSQKNRFHMHNLKDLMDANWQPEKSTLRPVQELSPVARSDYRYDVLFQCRLWDPNELAKRNRADAEKVNGDRIRMVRLLRQELGPRFMGGLQPNAYARRVAPDLMLSDRSMVRRKQYLDLVRSSAIVVSSAGLLGSNGWKLGEYVALGKAILSEPIQTKLPGDFEDGKHYLGYRSAEECMSNIRSLLDQRDRIQALSLATTEYYHNYLEPSALMWHHLRSLKSSLSQH